MRIILFRIVTSFREGVRNGKVKVEPLPSSDSTQIRLPCLFMILWHIASPIPVPEYSCRVCSLPNTSKIDLDVLETDYLSDLTTVNPITSIF